MTLTNPRIIVADPTQSLQHLVRAALELMGRRPRMIETYTANDAIAELRLGAPDLLISAYDMHDTTSGVLLAIDAKRELAALPVIVIASEEDPELDEDTISQSPFQYLKRPFSPETFLRVLRIALDGPEAAPKEIKTEEIIPVPPIEHEKLKGVMFKLMRDVGAMAIVLADRNGKVVDYEGAAGYFDRDSLAATLGPGFGDTIKLLPVVGEQPMVLKHYDGKRGTLFGLSVGLHYFLMLIFDGTAPASALGAVKRYGTSAVNEMLAQIGPIAFDPNPVLQAVTPALPPHKEEPHKKRKTRTQEVAAVRSAPPPPPPTPARVEKHERPEKNEPSKKQSTAPANFDPKLLDSLDSIDLSQADSLFDPANLAETGSSGSDDKISFDDAMLQGIIGNME